MFLEKTQNLPSWLLVRLKMLCLLSHQKTSAYVLCRRVFYLQSHLKNVTNIWKHTVPVFYPNLTPFIRKLEDREASRQFEQEDIQYESLKFRCLFLDFSKFPGLFCCLFMTVLKKTKKLKWLFDRLRTVHSILGTVKDIGHIFHRIKNRVRVWSYCHFNFWFVPKTRRNPIFRRALSEYESERGCAIRELRTKE